MLKFRLLLRNPRIFLRVRQSQLLLRCFSEEKPKDTNLYESLGLKSSATSSDIKKAYYDLTFKYHPDRNEGSTEASNKFREVSDAYEVLGNYKLRKRYDKGLPLPATKSKSAPNRPIVETPVKYQSFFDSRSSSSKKTGSQYQDFGEDMEELIQEKKFSERMKRIDEEYEKSRGTQYVVTIFFVVLLVLHKYYSS